MEKYESRVGILTEDGRTTAARIAGQQRAAQILRWQHDEARIVDKFTGKTIMNEKDYIAAYQKIADKYENNQSSMEDYLESMKKLKESYLKGNAGAALPTVP